MGISLLDTDDKIQKAWDEGERKKVSQENKKTSSFTPEDKLPLLKNQDTVIRIISAPVRVNFSFIKNDKGQTSYIKFPDYDENPDWILYKICNRVLKKTYKGKDEKTKKAIYEYDHVTTHKESFNIVYNNGFEKVNSEYGPQGWVKDGYRPDKGTFIQCINRQPFTTTTKDDDGNDVVKTYSATWCEENRKSLLLVKDIKGSTVPITVQKLLMESLFPDYGSFTKYDVAIKRLAADPWYMVRNAEVLTGPNNQAIADVIKKGPLDQDFLNKIEAHDLNKMAAPTSYKYIYDNLKGKIETIDREFQTNYLSELQRLVESETASKPSGRVVTPETTSASPATPVTPAPTTTVGPQAASADLEAKVLKVAPFFDKLPAGSVDKYIKDVADGKIIWKDIYASSLIECSECGKEQPVALDQFCVYCGVHFKNG